MAVNAWEDPGVHLGSLIPQRHFFLDTAWSPVEVEREIGAVIDPSATYRDRPWRGSRSIAGFWMTQRAHRSRAEARIIASGRVGPTAAGSRVAMTVRLPFMVSLFIGIYLGGVALGRHCRDRRRDRATSHRSAGLLDHPSGAMDRSADHDRSKVRRGSAEGRGVSPEALSASASAQDGAVPMKEPAAKVAVVTGANRGLGLALVRALCRTFGPEGAVYLCARDERRGESAARALEVDGLRPTVARLDVDDDASVAALAEEVRRKHGHVDVVIGNAGMSITPERPQRDQVEAFVKTNNGGTHLVMRHFGPLLADGARYLVVASGLGRLRYLDPPASARFDVSTMSLEEVDALMDEFVGDTLAGSARAEGMGRLDQHRFEGRPGSLDEDLRARPAPGRGAARHPRQRGLPGTRRHGGLASWFTDMSRAQSPDDAAADVVWLATLPAGTREPYGELVQHRRVLPFETRVAGKTAAELLDEIGIHKAG